MFISLVETEEVNIASEHDSFSKAVVDGNNFAESKDYGKIIAVQIFETDKVVVGSQNIKEQCKLIASLRTIR